MQLSFISLLVFLPALTAAHGYLCTPPPRGIEKESTQIDALKSPNLSHAVCRGEGPGQITSVQSGGSLTLGFKITAPHTGPCTVYLLDLDLDLSKQVKIAEKYDCAAPGKVGPWTVKIPDGISGRKVLRWSWEGRHVSPGEPYEQCVDLQIGGGGGTSPAPSTGNRANYDAGSASVPSYMPPPSYAPDSSASDDSSASGSSYGGDNAYGGAEPAYGDNANDNAEPSYGSTGDASDQGSPNQGGCEQGKYTCNSDGGFSVCNVGSWVRQSCGAGQVCAPSNGSIICVVASQATNY